MSNVKLNLLRNQKQTIHYIFFNILLNLTDGSRFSTSKLLAYIDQAPSTTFGEIYKVLKQFFCKIGFSNQVAVNGLGLSFYHESINIDDFKISILTKIKNGMIIGFYSRSLIFVDLSIYRMMKSRLKPIYLA